MLTQHEYKQRCGCDISNYSEAVSAYHQYEGSYMYYQELKTEMIKEIRSGWNNPVKYPLTGSPQIRNKRFACRNQLPRKLRKD